MYNSLKTSLNTSVPTFIGLIPRRIINGSSRKEANPEIPKCENPSSLMEEEEWEDDE